jgi:hypothetical protein
MRDASLQQEVRRGEPRLSGTDDDRVEELHVG